MAADGISIGVTNYAPPLCHLHLALLLTAASCDRSSGAGAYNAFMASDWGMGLRFGMQSVEVRNVLGEPTGRTELQSGTNSEWHYLSPESEEARAAELAMSADTPQLTLTFHNDTLVGFYNRYDPLHVKPDPPFFPEPVQGVKLGNRLSDLTAALGKPHSETVGREWRFSNEEGNTIRVLSHYEPLTEGSAELVCHQLQVMWAPPLEINAGEDVKKREIR